MNNPKDYWFKRIFIVGLIPIKWQGFLVIVIGILFFIAGITVGEIDDSPGAAGLGFLLMIVIIFVFGYWKGEKPK